MRVRCRWLAVVGLAVSVAGGALTTGRAQEPFPAGVEGELYYATRIDRLSAAQGGPLTVELDGVLDEAAWQRAAFHTYVNAWPGGTLPADDADCKPEFAVVADSEFIYIAWRIQDSLLNFGQSAGCSAFNDDAIEIHFDGNGEGIDCGSCSYGLDDVQLLIGADQAGKGDPALLEVGWVRSGGCVFAGIPIENETGLNVVQGVVEHFDDGDGTVGWQGEIAMSLKTATYGEWDVDPSHGNTVGLDVHFDDDDDGDGQDADDSALIWSTRDTNSSAWQNPGVWGKLQFITPGKPLAQVVRDIPDDLQNGSTGTVTLTVTPVIGEGVVVITETLPDTLVASAPTGGGTLANNTITWNLGTVSAPVTVSYTLSPDINAGDVRMPGTATIDGEPISISGDRFYRGSPITDKGFIKLWNHLGPFAFVAPPVANDHGPPGACDANGGVDLNVDWLVNADETLGEVDMYPWPGLVVRPDYGGTGQPGGGARAAGLVTGTGDTGTVKTDVPAVWKAGLSATDTVDHASPAVHSIDADDHLTYSCVYVTNNTGADIETSVGFGHDDSIQIFVGDVDVTGGGLFVCQGWGGPNQEQNTAPVTLPVGESRVLVKVADGVGASGFRLRFQDPADPFGPGLQPPDLTVSLESTANPPPVKVTRSFSQESFGIGDVITVTLAITTTRTASSVIVREVVPRLVDVSNISNSGVLAAGIIEWTLSNVTTLNLTYQMRPADCRYNIQFSGSSFVSPPFEAPVVGDASIAGTEVVASDLLNWQVTEVGATAAGVTQALGEHDVLVRGEGNGIALAKDAFHFTHTQQTGDFELVARIDCLEDVNTRGQGGLMVRDTLADDAATVFFYLTSAIPAGGGVGTLRASSRRETSASRPATPVTLTDGKVLSFPLYLKMARAGTKISLQRSGDGTTYTEIGSRDIGAGAGLVALGATSFWGLAVADGGAGAARYTFKDVSGPAFEMIAGGTLFHRGDADDNNELQLTDAIRILGYLFLGSTAPGCLEAADADNNGNLELTDAVRILGFLFLGSQPPAPPGPPPAACGEDPPDTGDLGCETYASCG